MNVAMSQLLNRPLRFERSSTFTQVADRVLAGREEARSFSCVPELRRICDQWRGEMTSVEVQRRNQTLLLGRWSITSLSLFLLALTVMQGCSTMSSSVASLPAPEISSPSKESSVQGTPPAHIGNASWYGPGFNGKTTASGDAFDETKMTAAHRTLPLGSKAKVTNLNNGKSVEVQINDRGPYAEGRIIDLSHAAAKALGIVDRGTARVSVELLEKSVSADAKKP